MSGEPSDPRLSPEAGPELSGNPEKAENYSLDEMVAALKGRDREKDGEGELVTREDGTTVRRVRKRKRRSQQPEKAKAEKKARKMIFLQLAGLLTLGLLLGGYFAYVFIRFNSSSFAANVEKNVTELVGAETKLDRLSVTPTGATAKNLTMEWGAGSFIKRLRLVDLKADTRLSDFVKVRLRGVDVGARQGELLLQNPTEAVMELPEIDPKAHAHAFELYYCQSLAVLFGEDPFARIKGTDAAFRHLNNSGYQVILNRGELELAGWSVLPISNATFTFRPGAVELAQLKLADPEGRGGEATLSGTVPLDRESEYQLFLTATDYPLENLLGKDLEAILGGRFTTSQGVVKGTVSEKEPTSIVVPFDAHEVSMSKLPMWTALDELFPDEGFLSPEFPDAATAVFQWSPSGVGVRSLKLRNASRLKLDGDIAVDRKGLLVGNLVLSINRGILGKQPLFTDNPGLETNSEDTGFARINIKLGGTVQAPTDNFREVLGMDLQGARPESQVDGFEDLFNELTEDPAE